MNRTVWLFMPTVNQKPEVLLGKTSEIDDLKALLATRGTGLRVLVANDGSKPEYDTVNTLALMQQRLGDMFEYVSYEKCMGKTITVAAGLRHFLDQVGPNDLIGCLDDNEHRFLSSLDLIERIDMGYLGAIGTIRYPDEFLNYIDRHAMPAVGAIESETMGLKDKLCIYASGYWIQHAEVVRQALALYPKYQELFRTIFPNAEAVAIPKWGTPTLMQELMNWVIRNRHPWAEVDPEFRRQAVCYLPCHEVPEKTPLGRSTEKATNQLRALVLNGIVLDALLGKDRLKKIDFD